jgi:hypothetical protein
LCNNFTAHRENCATRTLHGTAHRIAPERQTIVLALLDRLAVAQAKKKYGARALA